MADMQTTNELKLVVLTPTKRVVDAVCDNVYFPSTGGILGVLPGHTSLVCQVGTGVVHYTRGNSTAFLTVAGGVAEVFNNQVSLLVDIAEDAAAIDIERAQKALQRARDRLAGIEPNGSATLGAASAAAKAAAELDMNRAAAAEARALARIEAAASHLNERK